jgi:hypothetical protein
VKGMPEKLGLSFERALRVPRAGDDPPEIFFDIRFEMELSRRKGLSW